MTTAAAAAAWRRREAAAVDARRSAAEAIGPVELGLSRFLLTRGQFSMLDMVAHVVAQLRPCEVSVWTWAIADYEVEAMEGFIRNGDIAGARLIVDRSAERRNAAILRTWRARFGVSSVRVCKNHAKVARVWNGTARVLLRGSMNLNFNPRFEQADVTEGGPAFELVREIEDGLPVLPALCSNAEAEAASEVSRAWELSSLDAFKGLKRWK